MRRSFQALSGSGSKEKSARLWGDGYDGHAQRPFQYDADANGRPFHRPTARFNDLDKPQSAKGGDTWFQVSTATCDVAGSTRRASRKAFCLARQAAHFAQGLGPVPRQDQVFSSGTWKRMANLMTSP